MRGEDFSSINTMVVPWCKLKKSLLAKQEPPPMKTIPSFLHPSLRELTKPFVQAEMLRVREDCANDNMLANILLYVNLFKCISVMMM